MIFSLTTPIIRKIKKAGLLGFLMLSVFACTKSGNTIIPVLVDSSATTKPKPVVFPKTIYDISNFDTTKLFNAVPVVNHLVGPGLNEISGVVASRINPGILYIHNDSGNLNQVYLTDATGADRGTLTLTPVSNRDWEDIAVGPGPVSGASYVYVADIGDNDTKYSSVFVYRFPEPDLTGKTMPFVSDITQVDIIQLKYPDGANNAETLMVDPATKDIYIASKQSNLSKIYVARYPQSTTSATTMTPLVQLYFNKATGGDISPDGSEILLRSNELIWYWKLAAGTAISAGLLSKPQIAPYANNEPQGEGIGFAADGSGYYTTTEIKDHPGHMATVSFYKRK
ncbi:MAG: hypothetical protein ABI203_05825 [Mucilaginibacter sp.]